MPLAYFSVDNIPLLHISMVDLLSTAALPYELCVHCEICDQCPVCFRAVLFLEQLATSYLYICLLALSSGDYYVGDTSSTRYRYRHMSCEIIDHQALDLDNLTESPSNILIHPTMYDKTVNLQVKSYKGNSLYPKLL